MEQPIFPVLVLRNEPKTRRSRTLLGDTEVHQSGDHTGRTFIEELRVPGLKIQLDRGSYRLRHSSLSTENQLKTALDRLISAQIDAPGPPRLLSCLVDLKRRLHGVLL